MKLLLVFSFKLPPPLGTPSYPRGRVVYLVFEDGGVQNISRIKIYRTPIILKRLSKYIKAKDFKGRNFFS
ncbi:MAG: hypothetical protein IJB77_00970 [Bacteroidaceae bacterium]|nr:hypothetical protein [Bacteroidaceae bacterium]